MHKMFHLMNKSISQEKMLFKRFYIRKLTKTHENSRILDIICKIKNTMLGGEDDKYTLW